MYQAHLVGVYTPEEIPEELEGFVRYQAALDGHQMKAGERIAVLNVTGTSSYVPVFLADLSSYEELESKLSRHEVQADQVSKVSLQRVLQELVRN
ncbi:MAG: DUF749 family protein [Euryarchaeota archaeon]|nr:DUF749 family protein [Euryarchaeota archaeon]